MSEVTTITIPKETVEELKKMGRKGETYNDILKRLLKIAKMAEEHIKKHGLKEGIEQEPATKGDLQELAKRIRILEKIVEDLSTEVYAPKIVKGEETLKKLKEGKIKGRAIKSGEVSADAVKWRVSTTPPAIGFVLKEEKKPKRRPRTALEKYRRRREY